MTNQDENGNFDKVGAGRGIGWHADGTFEAIPSRGTMLHAIQIPSYGGNTMFANMYLAYETMPEALKSRAEGKSAWHRLRGRKHHTQQIVTGDDLKRMKDVLHPIFRVHPQTGKKSVFANPHHTLCVDGMSQEEGDALLEEIFAWCGRSEFVWEQEWKVGDTVLWENRSAWHSGKLDYPTNEPRRFLRTTVCDRQEDLSAPGTASSLKN